MEFRTTIKPLDFKGTIDHEHPLMLIGSCFSDNMGNRLQKALFDVEVNPFGTLYNPESIAFGVEYILDGRRFTAEELFKTENDNRYHSFCHHSSFSSVDPEKMLSRINLRIASAAENLAKASALVVSFGSAYVYALRANGEVVANCHKLPAKMFDCRMLDVEEITQRWLRLTDRLQRLNPAMKIIFTVSPIRHLAYGFHQNQLSKSVLHLAVDQVIRKRENAIYFPAYEIMNDDLRDYRFYARDMAHPSETAVEYIYSLFAQSFFDDRTTALASKCEQLCKRLEHRQQSDDTRTIEKFNDQTRQIIDSLTNACPYLKTVINRRIQNGKPEIDD